MIVHKSWKSLIMWLILSLLGCWFMVRWHSHFWICGCYHSNETSWGELLQTVFYFLGFTKRNHSCCFFCFFFLCKPFLLFYCWLKGQKHFRLVFFFYPMWCQTELVLKIWLPLKGLVHDNAHARRLSLQNKFVASTLNSKSPLPVQSLKILRFIRTSVALAGLVILR